MAKLSKMKTLINDFFSSEPPVLTEAEENALVSASLIPGAIGAHCLLVAMSKVEDNVYFEVMSTGTESTKVLGDTSCLIRVSTAGKNSEVSTYSRLFKAIGQKNLGEYLLTKVPDDKKPMPVLIGVTLASLPFDTVLIGDNTVRSILDIDNVVSSFPELDAKFLADFEKLITKIYKTDESRMYKFYEDALDESNEVVKECINSQKDLSYNYHSALSRRSMYALRQSEPSSDYSLADARQDLKTQTLDGDDYKSVKNVKREAELIEQQKNLTIDEVDDNLDQELGENAVLSKETIVEKEQLTKEQIEDIARDFAKKTVANNTPNLNKDTKQPLGQDYE